MASTYLALYDVWNLSSYTPTTSTNSVCQSTCDASAACQAFSWDQNHCYIITSFPLTTGPTSTAYTDISASYLNVKNDSSSNSVKMIDYLENQKSRYQPMVNELSSSVNIPDLKNKLTTYNNWKQKIDLSFNILDVSSQELDVLLSQEKVETDQTDLTMVYYQFILYLVITILFLGLLFYNSTTSTFLYAILYSIGILSIFILT